MDHANVANGRRSSTAIARHAISLIDRETILSTCNIASACGWDALWSTSRDYTATLSAEDWDYLDGVTGYGGCRKEIVTIIIRWLYPTTSYIFSLNKIIRYTFFLARAFNAWRSDFSDNYPPPSIRVIPPDLNHKDWEITNTGYVVIGPTDLGIEPPCKCLTFSFCPAKTCF